MKKEQISFMVKTGNISLKIHQMVAPDDTTLDVHYKIPVYYAVQLLCHMKLKDMSRCWYTSYSEQSVVVLELKMQEDV